MCTILLLRAEYHTYTALDFPVSLGQYRFPSSPAEPASSSCYELLASRGLPQRDQNRAGRAELLQTPFFEIRAKNPRPIGPHAGGSGFDPARTSKASPSTLGPGYAFTPNSLFDPDWKGEEKPWVVGRKPFGKIAIANSDAGANAYTNEAIDQAWRAVSELLHS